MKAHVRKFIEDEEATRAALSKAAKRQKRKRRNESMAKYLIETIEKVEANGNPAAAKQLRAFWLKFPAYAVMIRRYEQMRQKATP